MIYRRVYHTSVNIFYVKLQRIISLFSHRDMQFFLWYLPMVKSHSHYSLLPFDFPNFRSQNSESLARIKLTRIRVYAWYPFYFWLLPYMLSISIVTFNALHLLYNTESTIHVSTDSSIYSPEYVTLDKFCRNAFWKWRIWQPLPL